MKQFITRLSLIIIVIALCVIFADRNILWSDNTYDRVTNMTTDDIEVTIVDEDTIRIENLIKGDDLLYKWEVRNYIYDTSLGIGERILLEDKDVLEFTYEDLTEVYFRSTVAYDGYTYTSNTFYINEDGSIYQSTDEDDSSVEATDSIARDISDIVSLAFIAFLGILVLLYYIVPKSYQWLVLLGGSVYFYTLSGVQYMIFILISSLVAFWIAKKMSAQRLIIEAEMKDSDSKTKKQLKSQLQKVNRQWLVLALIATLGVMVVIKYTDFLLLNMNKILHTNIEMLSLVMPLGLSFYTFMLIAYLVDVYRGKYVAEEKYWRFFTFISFFPQVAQGPISRYNEVSPQLRAHHTFDYDNFCKGIQRILWGFFVKLVLADRAALFVNWVYDSYETQGWMLLVSASLLYSIQVYADFYSSMEIAIGAAQLFGIELCENFMRPYFSTSMPEFWRRWHITLGTWFKEYVFYPISISKRIMKFSVNTRKKYGANAARILAAVPPIMGVWILTGLWHGSSWKFVAWGLFHGVLILLSTIFSQDVQRGIQKLGIDTSCTYYRILQMLKVFLLCTIGRIFFRADSLSAAMNIFLRILTGAKLEGIEPDAIIESVEAAGIVMADVFILLVAIVILLIVSIMQESYGSVRELINQKHICIRWTIWILLLFAVILFGKYGLGTSSVFIYDAF